MKQFRQSLYLMKHLPLRLLLSSLALIVIATIWVSTFSRIGFEQELEVNGIMRANANLVKAFEEHIRRNLQTADDTLLFLKNSYEAHGDMTPTMLEVIHEPKSDPIMDVSVIGPGGEVLASSKPEFMTLNFADKESFQFHRAHDSGQPYLSKPLFGKFSKKWLFHISRRLNHPDGSFAGMITMGIDPIYFSNFYRQMNLGRDYAVTLIGTDGMIRLRQTADRLSVGGDAANAPLFSYASRNSQGSYVDVSVVDGSRRIYSYSTMPDYPLIMSVSVLESEVLAGFESRRNQYYGQMGLITVVILAMFGLLMSLINKKETAEEALRLSNEQLESKIKERTLALEALNRELQHLSVSDALTGIANRRYFDDYLSAEWLKALRLRHPLAIIMIDIDFFKDYNDTYGHQLGDKCVATVARILKAGVKRPADLVARYGGEEFAIILPDTDQAGAMVVAKKLRVQIEAQELEHKNSVYRKVTVSLGVAAMIPDFDVLPARLIELADRALYKAKKEGRNRVKAAPG